MTGKIAEEINLGNCQPRSGDRPARDECCGSRRSRNLSPLQGLSFPAVPILGLTPQATSLPPLRGLIRLGFSFPGAHAPGYESATPSGFDQIGFLVSRGPRPRPLNRMPTKPALVRNSQNSFRRIQPALHTGFLSEGGECLAAKRRHIHSLGREPQEHSVKIADQPRSGDRQ